MTIESTNREDIQREIEREEELFPNQDTMPKGGFGNLIALPLQRGARDAESRFSSIICSRRCQINGRFSREYDGSVETMWKR